MTRILRRALICACLGVIATIAVAWTCAFVANGEGWGTPIAEGSSNSWPIYFGEKRRDWGRGTVMYVWAEVYAAPGGTKIEAAWETAETDFSTVPIPKYPLIEEVSPKWALSYVLPDETYYDGHPKRVMTAYGWPVHTMSAYAEVNRDRALVGGRLAFREDAASRRYMGIEIGSEDERFLLPTTVMLPTFLSSAAVIAGALFTLWSMPSFVCYTRRRNQRRCVKCGYDFKAGKSQGCPECGWKRS